MHKKLWFACAAVLAALAIAACASGPPEHLYRSRAYASAAASVDGGADPGKIMICEESTVTGSHIRSRRCWSKLELDIARDRALRSAEEQKRLDR